MDINWFDKAENSSGAIGARIFFDASAERGLVGDTLGLLVQNATTAIDGLVIGFEARWQLALIILLSTSSRTERLFKHKFHKWNCFLYQG